MKVLSTSVTRNESEEQSAFSRASCSCRPGQETETLETADLVECDIALLSWESRLPADLKIPHDYTETVHQSGPPLLNRPAVALRLR